MWSCGVLIIWSPCDKPCVTPSCCVTRPRCVTPPCATPPCCVTPPCAAPPNCVTPQRHSSMPHLHASHLQTSPLHAAAHLNSSHLHASHLHASHLHAASHRSVSSQVRFNGVAPIWVRDLCFWTFYHTRNIRCREGRRDFYMHWKSDSCSVTVVLIVSTFSDFNSCF